MPVIASIWSSLSYLPYLLLIPFAQLLVRIVRQIKFTYDTHTNSHFASIPSLPRHWLVGNLHNAGPLLDPSLNRHPDYGFEEIWHTLNCPPVFIADLTPVDFAFLVVIDPTVAEAIAQPSQIYKYSVPKSDTLHSMHRLIGWESLIMAENDEWRNLRRRFNKGFSPQHLHSLSPLIISKTQVFINRLKSAAASHSTFLLKGLAQDLTTDIITELAIEKDFQAQTTAEGQGEKSFLGVLTASRILSGLVFKQGQGFDPLGWIDPIRPTRSWFYEQVFDWRLYNLVSKRLKEQSSATSEKKSRSITSLALDGIEPTPALIKNTVSQLKSFLFAGQDTTATLIQWICYELSRASLSSESASFLKQLTQEHDRVFGADPWSALAALSDPHLSEATLGDKLPYTTAWVKETLRLHPPAGTARYVPQVSSSTPPFEVDIPTVDANGKTSVVPTRLNGLRIYICQYLLHRNPSVWGADAHAFNPGRWLDEKYIANLPAGAWRPFERGPRNCIGQTLAQMEGVIVLCCVARGFEFEKVGLTGIKSTGTSTDTIKGDKNTSKAGNQGALKEKSNSNSKSKSSSSGVWRETDEDREVWAVNQVTSIPVDGMKMRVKLRA